MNMKKNNKQKIFKLTIAALLIAYNIISVEQMKKNKNLEETEVSASVNTVSVEPKESSCEPKKRVTSLKRGEIKKENSLNNDQNDKKDVSKKIVSKKNRIRVLGGSGFSNGLNVDQLPNGDIRISARREFVWGIGYSRQVTENVSVTVEALSSQTYLIGLEYGF